MLCGIRSDGVHQGALPLMTYIVFYESPCFSFRIIGAGKKDRIPGNIGSVQGLVRM